MGQQESVTHSTFVIERSYPATPERVFAAFADAGKKRRWFVEGEHHEVEGFEMDFRVGGKESTRVRFKEGTPVQGLACVNDTVYLDIVPNGRIVFASGMTVGGRCISASLATIALSPSAAAGTDVVFTHQAAFFEGADGPKMREEGWRKLLDRLVVECAR